MEIDLHQGASRNGAHSPYDQPRPRAAVSPYVREEGQFALECDTFLRLIANQTPERIYLITGPSDRGKSVLVGQFAELATRLGVRCAHEEFKASLPLREVLWDLSRDLAPMRFPRFEREHQRGTIEPPHRRKPTAMRVCGGLTQWGNW